MSISWSCGVLSYWNRMWTDRLPTSPMVYGTFPTNKRQVAATAPCWLRPHTKYDFAHGGCYPKRQEMENLRFILLVTGEHFLSPQTLHILFQSCYHDCSHLVIWVHISLSAPFHYKPRPSIWTHAGLHWFSILLRLFNFDNMTPLSLIHPFRYSLTSTNN